MKKFGRKIANLLRRIIKIFSFSSQRNNVEKHISDFIKSRVDYDPRVKVKLNGVNIKDI